MTSKKQSIYRFGALIGVLGVALAPVAASAVATSQSTTVSAVVGDTISMTTSGTVTINVIPTSGGSMSSASDTVSVSTNKSTGYTLTFADADATTTLVNGANSIAADVGTQAVPSTSLTTDRWGYRVDGVGGFGAGPTSAESNVASSTYKWAGVPATGTPNTLKTTAATASGDVTTVWYGVKATTANPSGTYSDSVTYTATTN